MADISTDIAAWSGTAGSNSPSGSTNVGTGLDDNLRAIQAALVLALNAKGSDLASASTVDLSATNGLFHDVTGTTTITGLGTVRAGVWKVLKFEGALTFTHNATSLIIPGGANITTANGDMCMVTSEGSGNWRVNWYSKASGQAVVSGLIAANNLSDVANAATAFGNIKQAASDSASGVAELATTAETQTGTDTGRVITPAGLAGALGFSKQYVSTGQTITAAGSLTLAHGLAAQPKLLSVYLSCTSADLNYSSGDEVFVPFMGDDNSRGVSVVPDATNLNVRYGSAANVFALLDKTTGGIAAIDATKWVCIFVAWA